MSLTARQLERFVERLAADPSRWVAHVNHDATRTYELIHEDEHVNAWLICWSEDADTGFHDHDLSAAAIHVLDGQVREDRLRIGGPPIARTLGPRSTFSVPPTAIHRVLHGGGGPAVTIHAYSPPLTRTGAYWIGPDGDLQRVSQCHDQELRELQGTP
jgi:quercetin dioxygenase-like cupin family protein